MKIMKCQTLKILLQDHHKPTLAERQKSQGEDYLKHRKSDYFENQESSENIYEEIPDNENGEVVWL